MTYEFRDDIDTGNAMDPQARQEAAVPDTEERSPRSRPRAFAVLIGYADLDLSSTWKGVANCRTVDPEKMFQRGASVQTQVVKDVCRSCMVKLPCLVEAYDSECESPNSKVFGVRGGRTERERRADLKLLVPRLPEAFWPKSHRAKMKKQGR